MAVCLSDYDIPCEEWQPNALALELEQWNGGPLSEPEAYNIPIKEDGFQSGTITPTQQEACTPTANDSQAGTWTPMTDDGMMDPALGKADEIPTYTQGWSPVQAAVPNEFGYYVPCMITPIGPPSPYGNTMLLPQQVFMPAPTAQVSQEGVAPQEGVASQEGDGSGSDPENPSAPPAAGQYPEGQVPVEGQHQIVWCIPASPNADGSPVVFAMSDGTPVMAGESPNGGEYNDQWGFLHEFQGGIDANGMCYSGDGMYFDPSMFPDGTITLDENGNPIWTMIDASQCGQNRLSHLHVPKAVDLKGRFDEENADQQPVTTIMIRNIPNRYTRKMLMDELDSLGFEGTYDFIYVPMDKSTHWNVGYAFVNFILPESASLCMEKLTDYRFRRFRRSSGKVTQVSPAHIQGLDKNMEHYSHTAVQSARIQSHRPLVVRPRPLQGKNTQIFDYLPAKEDAANAANPQSDNNDVNEAVNEPCEEVYPSNSGCMQWDQAPKWDQSRCGPTTAEGWRAQPRHSRNNRYPAAHYGSRWGN